MLIESVKNQGFEGPVAKGVDSLYEAGLRTGAWQKMRINRGQEFVIGGYISTNIFAVSRAAGNKPLATSPRELSRHFA